MEQPGSSVLYQNLAGVTLPERNQGTHVLVCQVPLARDPIAAPRPVPPLTAKPTARRNSLSLLVSTTINPRKNSQENDLTAHARRVGKVGPLYPPQSTVALVNSTTSASSTDPVMPGVPQRSRLSSETTDGPCTPLTPRPRPFSIASVDSVFMFTNSGAVGELGRQRLVSDC